MTSPTRPSWSPTGATRGEFILIFVWAIRLTWFFVYRQFLVVTGSRMFRIRALRKNSRSAWTRCLKESAEAYSAAVALVRDRRLRYESQTKERGERGVGGSAGPLIPAEVESSPSAAAAEAKAKRKLSALSREELLERCAELEVQNARLGLRLAAAERDDVRRDGSASSDSEDELNDGSSDSGSSEYGSVASFASAHTSTFAQDSETSGYLQAVELINRHDFAVATSTGDDASRGGTIRAVTGRQVGDGGEAFGPDVSMGSDGGDDDDEEEEEEDELENEEASSLSDDDDEDVAWTPRARLPAPQPVNRSFSLFSILRHAIGKDLTKISLPATINQPLTIIQRTVEDLEYIHLLYDALDAGPGMNRMTGLVAFCVSAFGGWYWRKEKPFSPTLGETYDWQSPDGRVRALVEQVEYFPPVCVWHVEGTSPGGTRFEMSGELAGVSKFWGSYVEFLVNGCLHMRLPDTGESFSWEKAAMHVNNVISGDLWIDMVGTQRVVAHTTGETAPQSVQAGEARQGDRGDSRQGRREVRDRVRQRRR